VRVSLPEGPRTGGLTVGLVGEDGVALGPAVVAPEGCLDCVEVEVRGPCHLPPGAVARVVVHGGAGEATTHETVLAQRAGLHAWLMADARLPLTSRAELKPLAAEDRRRLAERWCWFGSEAPAEACDCASLPAELRDMLSEFGVDADEISEELAATLRGR
jgi:hypothetical protein